MISTYCLFHLFRILLIRWDDLIGYFASVNFDWVYLWHEGLSSSNSFEWGACVTIFVFDKLVVGLKTFDKSGKKRSSSTKKGRDPHVKKISSLATAHTIFKIIIKTLAKKIHTLQTAFPFFKLSFSFCENLFPGGSHAFRKKGRTLACEP